MGLRLTVPLPGPFTYSRSIARRRRTGPGAGSWLFLTAFVGGLVVMLGWWVLVPLACLATYAVLKAIRNRRPTP